MAIADVAHRVGYYYEAPSDRGERRLIGRTLADLAVCQDFIDL